MSAIVENALHVIEKFYGERKAERSGVPLINHIHEGLRILDYIKASEKAKAAFCLHPMFQHDEDLFNNFSLLKYFDEEVVAFIMEYRNIANANLSDNVRTDTLAGIPIWFGKPISLSPLKEVNDMLIADKVQNYTDFNTYHYGKHIRSAELDLYFRTWIETLGVVDKYLILALEGKRNDN